MCNVNKFNYLKPYIEIVLTYHDVGKVLPYFQRKTINNEEYKPFDVYANVPHSLFSALMVDPDELKNISINNSRIQENLKLMCILYYQQ